MATGIGNKEAAQNVILRTLAGSEAHGLVDVTGDRDEMGIYIEPPDHVIGTKAPADSYVWRTQAYRAQNGDVTNKRSGPGDLDYMSYSLRKYTSLALAGNPSILVPMWVPTYHVLEQHTIGMQLRSIRDAFISQQAVHRFLGYMHSQRERMHGRGPKQNRVPNRPELIEKYGWDVKYGAHALRLAYQGLEVATFGVLNLPMLPNAREMILDIRKGKYDRDEVSDMVTSLEADTRHALATTPLPEYPDYDRVNAFLKNAHITYWQQKDMI